MKALTALAMTAALTLTACQPVEKRTQLSSGVSEYREQRMTQNGNLYDLVLTERASINGSIPGFADGNGTDDWVFTAQDENSTPYRIQIFTDHIGPMTAFQRGLLIKYQRVPAPGQPEGCYHNLNEHTGPDGRLMPQEPPENYVECTTKETDDAYFLIYQTFGYDGTGKNELSRAEKEAVNKILRRDPRE